VYLLQPIGSPLRSAPWLFVRGNHEDCKRGGKGWSRLFDPAPFDAAHGCNATDAPWLAHLPGLALGIIDNALIGEGEVDAPAKEAVSRDLAMLAQQSAKAPLWVFMHALHDGEIHSLPARGTVKY